MVERKQVTDSLEKISVGKEDAEAFFMSDVGIGAIRAYTDMIQEFIENNDKMFSIYPELTVLFEFAIFVRGPAFLTKNPGDGLETFLASCVGSTEPEEFMLAALKHMEENK